MTKKTATKTTPLLTLIPGTELLDNEFTNTVKDSAQQIWLAGLGAFSKAQEEGGKVFEALVKEGVSLHRKTQSAAEEKLSEVSQKVAEKMTGIANDVSTRTGQQWDKIETIFEERTAKALARLGVPNAQALKALTQRVAALEAQLGKATPAAKTAKPAARKRAA